MIKRYNFNYNSYDADVSFIVDTEIFTIVDDNKRIIPHVPVAERSYIQEGTDVVVELSKESQLALCWDLRRLTGEGLMTCKEALKENNWDIKQAQKHLITHSKYIRW